MSKGFGKSVPQVKFILAPFMDNYDEVLIARHKDKGIIELQGIANLLRKDIGHIKKIISDHQILSFEVNDTASHRLRQVVYVDGLMDIFHAEIENDNPMAEKLYREASSHSLLQALKFAASKGESSIYFSGIQIDFEMIDGEPHVSLASLARLSGVSEEEVEERINSPEFQRYYRSIQD
jgi:hypothetical protein